jgi:hypothetical protein
MKSWKTTLSGIAGAIGLIATALAAQFDNDPNTVAQWSIVVPTLITSLGLLFARDANVTSEQQGAK